MHERRSNSKSKINDFNNTSLLSNENKTVKNKYNKSINFSSNQKTNFLKTDNKSINRSIEKNKEQKDRKSASKNKNLNKNTSINSRTKEDKNYVRNIFNNLNHNKEFGEEKITFNNNFGTVKVSATCVSTKDKMIKQFKNINETNYSNIETFNEYSVNNTKNALIKNSNKNNNKINFNLEIEDEDLYPLKENKNFSPSRTIKSEKLHKEDYNYPNKENNEEIDAKKLVHKNQYDHSNAKSTQENLNRNQLINPYLENLNSKKYA